MLEFPFDFALKPSIGVRVNRAWQIAGAGPASWTGGAVGGGTAIKLAQLKGPPMTKTSKRSNTAPKATGAAPSRAIDDGMETPETSPTKKPPSKIDQVVALLCRPTGATLDELVAATGWQPHTTRATLAGLKKKGHVITSEKVGGVRRYRVGKPS